MNIILPDNIFARIISSCFHGELAKQISFLPTSQVTQTIINTDLSVGLIPVMDLLNHKDLFVSSKFGVSFEGALCNSYLYYLGEEKSFEKLSLYGDISSQEVILLKILFKELYGIDIQIEISTHLNNPENRNLLIVGDENFVRERFNKGISFAESMVETLSLPFVNYVFASKEKEELENFVKEIKDIDSLVYSRIEKGNFDKKISQTSEEYIKTNIASLILKFDEQDVEGIKQVLRLPYFHGIISDIVEVKFI
jgi:predicted solute-binding protein